MITLELILTLLGIASFAVIIYLIHQLINKVQSINVEKKKTRPVTVKDDAIYGVQINRLIYQLKHDIHADKVCVARFHNGGAYSNGFDMKKFSVTHETPLGSSEPMMDRCQAILNSRYPDAFLQLVTLGTYIVNDVVDCTDPNFKHDMAKYGFQTTYLFRIKQYDGNDEGFLGINYKQTKVLTPEERQTAEETIPTLLGLLNMTKQK
jgi:hypothetical protein